MATTNCLLTNILQNIFFCVQQMKETHTGLEQHEGGVNDDSFHFWVNYGFFNVVKFFNISYEAVQLFRSI